MEELDNNFSQKRRRISDKTHISIHDQPQFDDLRHESLNQILKHNMEIFKHNDMHNFDDGMDDDENNNNNDNNLSGETSSATNDNCVGQIIMTKCSNGGNKGDHEDDDTTLVHFNQLIDDERESKMNEDDAVS